MAIRRSDDLPVVASGKARALVASNRTEGTLASSTSAATHLTTTFHFGRGAVLRRVDGRVSHDVFFKSMVSNVLDFNLLFFTLSLD